MKKVIVLLFAVTVIASCSNAPSTDQIESSVKKGFQDRTNYAVSEVTLIKKDKYLYEGFVTLEKDHSQATIEVDIDKDDPTRFIWKVTAPSPIMIQDAIAKSTAQMQKTLDSAAKADEVTMRRNYDSLVNAINVEPESDDH